LRSGDEDAARGLWERYCTRLVDLAGGKLPRDVRRDFDEEDVALSAFHSLCKGVQEGRFPELTDASGLWPLLALITARKAMHRLRARQAVKRGAGQVQGESAIMAKDCEDGDAALNRIIGKEPTPEFAAQVAEESENLLGFLDDPSLRRIASLKLEGHTNDEIAAELGQARRTVERRLALIRRIWTERVGDGDVNT
jgi:DNA-directed RNA polymerase specialized sigma24 family protein